MIDLRNVADGLSLGDDGIWYAESTPAISYPEDGNQMCLGIEDDSFWFKHRNECIVEAVRAFPPTGPIFDVGGGNGYVAAALTQAGFDVVLVEPGRHGSRAAKELRRIPQVVRATLDSARFLPGSLPAVGLFDVLEHIETDREFLRTLHGLLTRAGKLYVTVPARRLLWSAEDVAAGHYRRYSPRALAGRLADQGFAIDYLTCFFTFLPLPIFFFRSLPTFLGLRRRRKAQRVKKEHLVGKSKLARVAAPLLAREVDSIRRGKTTSLGASCLVVASRGGRARRLRS